jgi:hypothetical protein
LAVEHGIAGLGTVAVDAVVTVCIIGYVVAGIVDLVTGVVRAVDTVTAVNRYTILAGAIHTRLRAIAEGPIVTVWIGFAFVACIPLLITVLWTGIATRLTPILVIAGFGAITEEAVIAESVIGYVIARIGAFIARISCTVDTVVTIDICASLADTAGTGLGTVAVKSIVTVIIPETVDALIPCLVTSLSRAGIVASLTGPAGTRFRAIAEGPIVTGVVVVGDVLANIIQIAIIVSTGISVVTVRIGGTPPSLNISCNGICPCA